MPTLSTGSVLIYIAFIHLFSFFSSKINRVLETLHRKCNLHDKLETSIQPTRKKTQPTWVAAFPNPLD